MLLCSDQLFVQNQVNRPRFESRELSDYIKHHEAVKRAEQAFEARPLISPAELVILTRAARKGKRTPFLEKTRGR
jgi:hypothetical protein